MIQMSRWLICLVVGLLLTLVASEYDAKSDVEILTDKNFESQVLQSEDYWLVEFYAPWCGHCQKLEPEWKKAAKKLRGKARLGAVDATVHTKLAQRYSIQGYPTIKEFGTNKKKPTDYQGGRTKKDIVNYVANSADAKKLGVSTNAVQKLDFNSFQRFVSQDPVVPSAIFFGSKKSSGKKASAKVGRRMVYLQAPKWLNKLSKQFAGEPAKKSKANKRAKRATATPAVRFGFVPFDEAKIAKHLRLGDADLPALVVVYPSENTFVSFDAQKHGELSAKTALQFISDASKSSTESRSQLPKLPLFPTVGPPKKKPQIRVRAFEDKHVASCTAKSSKKKLCVVVAAVNAASQSHETEEEAQAHALKSLAKKYRRDPFAFYQSATSSSAFDKLQQELQLPPPKDEASHRVVVLKAGRRLKYIDTSIDHLGQLEATVGKILDKVLEGSAAFTTLQLPEEAETQEKSANQQRQEEQEREPRLDQQEQQDRTEEELHEEL